MTKVEGVVFLTMVGGLAFLATKTPGHKDVPRSAAANQTENGRAATGPTDQALAQPSDAQPTAEIALSSVSARGQDVDDLAVQKGPDTRPGQDVSHTDLPRIQEGKTPIPVPPSALDRDPDIAAVQIWERMVAEDRVPSARNGAVEDREHGDEPKAAEKKP